MRRANFVLSTVAAFAFALAGCNKPVDGYNGQGNLRGKSQAAADSAKSQTTTHGKPVDANTGSDVATDTGSDTAGKPIDATTGKPVDGQTSGKPTPDQNPGTDGSDGTDGGTTGTGDGGTTAGSDGSGGSDGDVIVDIPSEKCAYNDPSKPTWTIPANQFGQGLPPIDVPNSAITGAIQADGQTFIGSFTLFQEGPNSTNWSLTWDGKGGRIPNDYSLVVVNAAQSSCRAYVRFVKQNPRTLAGCFDINTKLRMADGKDMIIAMISKGDKVLNPVTHKPMTVAEVVKGKEDKKPMYEVHIDSQVLLLTETHPMQLKSGALKQAKELKVNDEIMNDKGQYKKVTVAKQLPLNKNEVVVNVRLETASTAAADHMVLANGIVAGDLFLQRQLIKQHKDALASHKSSKEQVASSKSLHKVKK